MRFPVIRAAFVALAVALSFSEGRATAQPAASPDAVTLGHEALDLYAKGDWSNAFDRFARADSAAHSPVFGLYMARCRRNEGKLLAAHEAFASVAAESLAPSAPEAWQKARVDAAAEVTAIEARIPSVIVALSGAPIDGATVTIDGAPVAASALGKPIRLDPGDHTFVARARDRASIPTTIRLIEGPDPRRIDLLIPAEPPREIASKSPAIPADPQPPLTSLAPSKGSLVPGIVVLGVGAAGLGVGAITGVIARSNADEVKAGCNAQGHCLRSDESKAASAQTLATVSTVSFIVGGAAAAAGIALVIIRPGGSRSNSEARAAIAPTVGGLVLTGGF